VKLSSSEITRIEMISQGHEDGISLAQGALRIGGVSPKIRNYVSEILKTDKADYYGSPGGTRELKHLLLDSFKENYSVNLPLSKIMACHGAMGGFASLALAVLKPGDEVLIPEPSYPVHKKMVSVVGATPKIIPFHVKAEMAGKERWEFDFDAIEKNINQQTRMMILANPSNPLGAVLTKKELETLIELAEKHSIYLVFDEAYEDFVFEGDFCSAISYIEKSDLVVRLGTFSKSHAMSGWRIGSVVASMDLIEKMTAVQATIFSSPSLVSQYAACGALKNPEIPIAANKVLKESLDVAVEELEPLVKSGFCSYVKPKSSFFLFLKLAGHDDTTEFVHDFLHAKHVSLVPGKVFGPSFKKYVRICFARPKDVVREGIRRLKDFVD
jgi:aspartate aminotransferase